MKQIVYIGGWDCFRSEEAFCQALKNREYEPFQEYKNRKPRFKMQVKDEYEMAFPNMPNIYNAKYTEWKIWFEKIFPFLNNEKLILIGHSLWSSFLAKYLSENTFPKRIDQLHLLAGVFDEHDLPKGEDYLGDFVFDPMQLKNLEHQVDKIFLYHSHDDTTVPFINGEKFKKHLPNAMFNIFENKGHFWQMEEFPELVENITK